ncbi:MAG: recombination directionality factor [Burkholderiales bacterium]
MPFSSIQTDRLPLNRERICWPHNRKFFSTSLTITEGCKPYGRLNVLIDGQEDALASFIFRTTGYNSIRTLSARLQYFRALASDALPCLELSLKLRAKSTTQSHRAPVYFVDLVAREGLSLEQALQKAKQDAEARKLAGWDQAALDRATLLGFANGAFEDSEEDAEAVVEEFFNAGQSDNGTASPVSAAQGASTLTDKLKAKVGATPQATSDQPGTI